MVVTLVMGGLNAPSGAGCFLTTTISPEEWAGNQS